MVGVKEGFQLKKWNRSGGGGASSAEGAKSRTNDYPHHEYYWVGNQWIPPQGVPRYTPLDFLEYFRNRNVLVIGDSTGRRSYLTLYALMEAAMGVDDDVDTHSKRHNLHVADLDDRSVIDINRSDNPNRKKNNGPIYNESCDLADRKLHNVPLLDPWTKDWFCRNLDNDVDKDIHDTKDTSSSSFRGKFDFRGMNCLHTIVDFLTAPKTTKTKYDDTSMNHHDQILPSSYLQDYDLVIVMAGVWETLRDNDCNGNNSVDSRLRTKHGKGDMGVRNNKKPSHSIASGTAQKRPKRNKRGSKDAAPSVMSIRDSTRPEERVTMTLQALKKVSSPGLQIAYRTVGFVENHAFDDVHWDMIHSALDFFAEIESEKAEKAKKSIDNTIPATNTATHHSNITLVDWGSVVSDRSWGEDRIQGDIAPHYGLEARLLFAQQLLHQLLDSTI